METVSSRIEIKAPPGEILDVICDFESYPAWARGVKAVRVVRTDSAGRPQDVEFEVQAGPLPKMRYVLRYTYRPDGIAWEYVEGDLKDMRGSYSLVARDGSTDVTYELAIDPGPRLPLPGFLKARAAREITKVALQELKRRVERG